MINTCIMATIIAYLLVMVAVGFKFSKENKSAGDFYLGGRKLGPFVTAMSAEASDMSSWLLMGLPGVVLAGSLAEGAWTAIGLALGTYVNWLIVAKRIRRYTVACDAVTIPEFFQKRYRDNTGILKIAAAFIIVIFFIPYTASGFSACGKLFSTIFGVEYVTAMIISAIVIVGYTALGGFSAASTTDFIQSIIMTVALFIVVGFGFANAGGISGVIENAKAVPGYFSLTSYVSHTSEGALQDGYGVLTIVSTLAWGLGYFGMPHILLRFMAARDEKELKLSRRIASVWVVISMGVALVIGVVGYSLATNGALGIQDVPGFIGSSSEAERIVVVIAGVISKYGPLFAIVGGLILAGILASTMSTADSQLLAASSSISEDIIKDKIKKNSKISSMLIARIVVVLIAVIGVIIALDENSSVFKIVAFSWAGFGATFGPVVLLALFWKRSNKWGAIAGMISGGIMVFLWKFVIANLGGIFAIYELLPAFIVALVVDVAVSLLTAEPEQEIIDEFEKVKSGM